MTDAESDPRDPRDPAAGSPGRSRRYVVPAVLAGSVVVFLWDCLLAGRSFVLRDAVFDFLPWRRFAAGAARDGHVPLWNPLSRFGQPFVAEPQSGFFYLPHHLFDFLPAAAAFDLTIALHLFVAAIGTYGLLRRFDAAKEAAVLAAFVFAFGTYFTVNLEFMSVMDTLAWAPLTILLVCRVGDGGNMRRVAARTLVLTFVLALQIFAGQIQVMAFTCVAALTYAIAAGVAEKRRGAALASSVGLVAAALLAAGLALVQVLPTLDLLPHSIRAGGVDPGLDIASMSPRHLATVVFPFAFGGPGTGNWWGVTLSEFWMGCFHVGLTPLVAAAFVALGRRRGTAATGAAAASAVLLIAGLLVAMGKYTPVYGWLQALPTAELVRWPAKGLQLVAIAIAVLAGLGFDALLARRESTSGRIDRGTLAVLSVAGVLALVLIAAAAKDGAATVSAFTGGAPEGTDTGFLAEDARRSAAFLVLGVLALAAAALRTVPRAVGVGLVLTVSFANLYILSREIQFVGDDALLDLPPPVLAEQSADGVEARVHSDLLPRGVRSLRLARRRGVPNGGRRARGQYGPPSWDRINVPGRRAPAAAARPGSRRTGRAARRAARAACRRSLDRPRGPRSAVRRLAPGTARESADRPAGVRGAAERTAAGLPRGTLGDDRGAVRGTRPSARTVVRSATPGDRGPHNRPAATPALGDRLTFCTG